MKKKDTTQIATVGKPFITEQRLKKSVGAIHSTGNLTLVQRKLANALLHSAYDTLLTKRTHTIPVFIMCAMVGWDASNHIDHLKEALLALQQTTIQFNLREDGHEVWESMSMLSYAQIKNGICTYRYDEALAEKLYDPSMFAMINLRVQRQLDTAYALNLYENLYRFINTNQGSTGEWSLELFRKIIGATANYYDDYRELNRKIIKPSLQKINRDTDIEATVETIKKSRQVIGLKFFVREKNKEEKDVICNILPGRPIKERIGTFTEIQNTAAFKALKKHGIADRLALAWICEMGEKTVLNMVAYTEDRDGKKLINTNTRAYMQSLVRAGAEFGQCDYDKIKDEKAKTIQNETQNQRIAELKAEFTTYRIKKARNELSLEDRKKHAKAWLESPEGMGMTATFNDVTGRFENALTNIAFEQVYLAKIVTREHALNDFYKWLKEEKNIDPATLGLESPS